MSLHRFNLLPHCAWLLVLLSPLPRAFAQFVELTAEIELNDWDYPFFIDRVVKPLRKSPPEQSSLFHTNGLVHCVVGTNTWLMEVFTPSAKRVYWFTGTNLIQHFESMIGQAVRSDVVIRDSLDGNPGRPVRVADLMTFDTGGRFCWLALCSGSFLERKDRQVYPPGDLWKESSLATSGWTDQTTRFKDSLGLPRSLDLLATNNQPIFQYQVHQTTNIAGWTFPLEFYGVQYLPTASNLWKLHLTLKGRITSIGPGQKPQIPEQLLKTAHRLP